MKKALLILILCAVAVLSFAQQETFDVITYSAPNGWKKEAGESTVSYTLFNNKNNSWCRINLVKSTVSKGSIEKDFESEWQEMVVKSYQPATAPQTNEIQEVNGWKTKAGGAVFTSNGSQAMVFLTTATGFNRCASIIATTNSQEYLKNIETILASITLIKIEAVTIPQAIANNDKNSITGTWSAYASDSSNYRIQNGIVNYTTRQYTFNNDGTYIFVSKTFDPLVSNILLGKENGVFEMSAGMVTITPKKSVLEAWSKKNDRDEWGKLINSQNSTLEKVAYRITKHYFEGTKNWNLVMQADKPTKRDGPHSNNKTFTNAWYYGTISFNKKIIELPPGKKIISPETAPLTTVNNTGIVGSWGVATTMASAYMMNVSEGSITTQYTFNNNGTYSFYIKTFQYQLDKLLLTRETGTYQTNGNSLTVTPQKSVVEAWSRKDGTDNWGRLLSTSKADLEKVSYTFSIENFGLGNVLILKAGKPTKRDGNFNNSAKDAWFYPATSGVNFLLPPN